LDARKCSLINLWCNKWLFVGGILTVAQINARGD